jgi:hypothetical protein
MNPNEVYQTSHHKIISKIRGGDNYSHAENKVYENDESSDPAESVEPEESELPEGVTSDSLSGDENLLNKGIKKFEEHGYKSSHE